MRKTPDIEFWTLHALHHVYEHLYTYGHTHMLHYSYTDIKYDCESYMNAYTKYLVCGKCLVSATLSIDYPRDSQIREPERSFA